MALLWIEGFEGFGSSDGSAVSGLSVKYSSDADSNFTLRAGRVSGHSVQLGGGNVLKTPSGLTTTDTLVVGFAFKAAGFSAQTELLNLYDGASRNVVLNVLSGGEFQFYRNSTPLGSGSSGAAPSTGTWVYIEVKVKTNGSTGTCTLYVNGVAKLTLTSQNTKNGSNNYCDAIQFKGSSGSGNNYQIDDVYVLDTSGSANNDVLGSQVVVAIVPSGAGASTDWTPSAGANYTTVDENPANGDTDYVGDGTSGHKDTYAFADASAISNIKGIQINAVARETDATPFGLLLPCKSSSTTSDGSSTTIGSTSYRNIQRVMEQDPNTSAQWTLSNLNAAEFGVKVN